MTVLSEKMMEAATILGNKARCKVLVTKLTDRQLATAINVFQEHQQFRKEEQAKQAALEEERQGFLKAVQEEAARLNLGKLSFEDHHTGQPLAVRGSKSRKPYVLEKNDPCKHFVSDKEGYHHFWRGSGHVPPAFKAAGCTSTNKDKFLANNIVITKTLFSDELRVSLKVQPPSTKLRVFLESITAVTDAQKRKATLLKLSSECNNESETESEDTQLTTKEAAAHIGYSGHSLKVSRSTGKLAGLTPPTYTRKGRACFYDIHDLDEWLAQFEKTTPPKPLKKTTHAKQQAD